MSKWIKTHFPKALMLCASTTFVHWVQLFSPLKIDRKIRREKQYKKSGISIFNCLIKDARRHLCTSATQFSHQGLIFVDTTSSHRKWFVNNTLPVTGAKSVQTNDDLLYGCRVQLLLLRLIFRLSQTSSKSNPSAALDSLALMLEPGSGTLSSSATVPPCRPS